jgi:23S rRNA pseudouridine1911/1915/1917 synthase
MDSPHDSPDELLYSFKVSPEQAGLRLDKFLADSLSYLSRERLQAYIKEGYVQVDGKLSKPAYKLSPGELVTLELPPEEETTEVLPEALPLDILYEDEHIAVVNKPAGLVVHPAFGNWSGTLVNALMHRYPALRRWPNPTRAGIVHRLDKETSGAMIVALTQEAYLQLVAKFQQREVIKLYWALVDGAPPTETGTIEAEIGRDAVIRKRMKVARTGKYAVTDFRILERYPHHSWLEVHIETGRTHQIRVHLAFIGCPVAGDRVYGRQHSSIALERFFLHARSLTFRHPLSDEELYIEAPLAPELDAVLKDLQALKQS